MLSENYFIQTGYFLYNWNNIHFKQVIISYAQKLILASDYHFLQWESSIPILGVLGIQLLSKFFLDSDFCHNFFTNPMYLRFDFAMY